MNDDRSLERAARSWLEDGPTQAPDRVVEAALLHIETTSQERDLRVPWRVPNMSTPARLAAAAAIAIVVVGGGVFALGSRPSGVGGPAPTPAPTAQPSPTEEDPALGEYRDARNKVCLAGVAAKGPLMVRHDMWTFNPAATEAQRADGIAALEEFVSLLRSVADQLEAIPAPPALQAEHLENVADVRAGAAMLDQGVALLKAGDLDQAGALDEATSQISEAIEQFERKYGLAGCP
jgi:hypothetical protein